VPVLETMEIVGATRIIVMLRFPCPGYKPLRLSGTSADKLLVVFAAPPETMVESRIVDFNYGDPESIGNRSLQRVAFGLTFSSPL
jgi:hypothetical protein